MHVARVLALVSCVTVSEGEHVVSSALEGGKRHAVGRVQPRVVHVPVAAPREIHALGTQRNTNNGEFNKTNLKHTVLYRMF